MKIALELNSSTIKLSENQPTSDLISSAFLPKAGSFETSFPESEIFINSNQIIINSKNNSPMKIVSSKHIGMDLMPQNSKSKNKQRLLSVVF